MCNCKVYQAFENQKNLLSFFLIEGRQLFQDKHWDMKSIDTYFKFDYLIRSFRLIPDFTNYWTQLVLILALAIERYILICRGADAPSLMRFSNRMKAYSVVIFLCILMPLVTFLDFYLSGGVIDHKTSEHTKVKEL